MMLIPAILPLSLTVTLEFPVPSSSLLLLLIYRSLLLPLVICLEWCLFVGGGEKEGLCFYLTRFQPLA